MAARSHVQTGCLLEPALSDMDFSPQPMVRLAHRFLPYLSPVHVFVLEAFTKIGSCAMAWLDLAELLAVVTAS